MNEKAELNVCYLALNIGDKVKGLTLVTKDSYGVVVDKLRDDMYSVRFAGGCYYMSPSQVEVIK